MDTNVNGKKEEPRVESLLIFLRNPLVRAHFEEYPEGQVLYCENCGYSGYNIGKYPENLTHCRNCNHHPITIINRDSLE